LIAFLPPVFVAAPSHRWDLVRGLVTLRRREIALASVSRVVVFPACVAGSA
jgi:hypothetical protein